MARKKSATKKAREANVNEKSEPVVVEPVVVKKTKPIESDEEDYSEELSSEEDEDDFGELITDEVEEGIAKVLNLIKSGDKKSLLDPKNKFFEDPEKAVAKLKREEKHKPVYLKDYHRMNLLSGNYEEEEEAEQYEDGEKPFAVQQREERNQLLSEIKGAFGDDNEEEDEEDEGDFLTVKSKAESAIIPKLRLPDPNRDREAFLQTFVDSHAWIPKSGDKEINLDNRLEEDDDQFDDAVEKFEHVYNFRYEDSNSAEIVSYARNQATSRRSETNSRRKQREQQSESKKQDEVKKEEKLTKKKKDKLNKVVDRLKQIKEAVGDEVDDKVIEKVFGDSLLNDDFDDADWDAKMAEIFNEQYYDGEAEKPNWDGDEIMGGFSDEEKEEVAEEDEPAAEEDEPLKKKSKKDKLKEKKSKKKEKETIHATAEKIVTKNVVKIVEEVEEEERGRRGEKEEVMFRYRDVSPETFGLTTREILLADDKQLNEFIGIKKFAPYRPKELRTKDKRKYTKKKHLKEWRKTVFKNENGPRMHTEADEDHDIVVRVKGGDKRKHGH